MSLNNRTFIVEGMSDSDAMELTGTRDRNLKALADAFGVEISFRDNAFLIQECDDVTYGRISAVLNAQPDADVHAAVLDRATGEVLYERTVRLPKK